MICQKYASSVKRIYYIIIQSVKNENSGSSLNAVLSLNAAISSATLELFLEKRILLKVEELFE